MIHASSNRPGSVLLLAVALGACASLTRGTTQTVTVNTEPPGAVCRLVRGVTEIAVADPTPASVIVDRSKDEIAVTCGKEDYQDGRGILASEFDERTLGNLVFGGLIGIATDAASGAMHAYPSTITVLLPPVSFATAQDRDVFFARLKSRIAADASKRIYSASRQCAPEPSSVTACQERIMAIEAERDADLERAEAQRIATPLRG